MKSSQKAMFYTYELNDCSARIISVDEVVTWLNSIVN